MFATNMKTGYISSILLKLFILFITADLTASFLLQYPTLRTSRISRIPSTIQLNRGVSISDADHVNYIGGASSIGGLSTIGLGGVPGYGGLLGGHLGIQHQPLGLRRSLGIRGVAAPSPVFLSTDTPDAPDFVVARSGSLADLTRAHYLKSLTDADNIVVG